MIGIIWIPETFRRIMASRFTLTSRVVVIGRVFSHVPLQLHLPIHLDLKNRRAVDESNFARHRFRTVTVCRLNRRFTRR